MDKEKKVQGEKEEKQEVKKEEKTENKEKELNEQISKLKDELADVKDRHTRLIAEFDNLKKRSAKEREGLYNSIIGDIISSLLPVIDNLEKATEAETKDEEYKKGIELVLKQFKDVLTANGVKEIEAVGQPFDPELHEAVSMIQDEKLGEKLVLVIEGDNQKIDEAVFDALDKYEKPKEVLFIPKFKQTENGKILRKETSESIA